MNQKIVKITEEIEAFVIENEQTLEQFRIQFVGRKGRYRDWETDRKSTRLNSSHSRASRMPSSA